MTKNSLFAILSTTALIAAAFLASDGLVYLVAALLALVTLSVLHSNRSRVMKITRWAKANPGRAQGFIAAVQFALMTLCVLAGYNLNALGFHFSDSTAYVFSGLMILGFLAVPFRPLRSVIALPKDVNRHRLAYLAIIISSVMTTAFFGNRVGDLYPDSLVSTAIKTVDQAIFSDHTVAYFDFEEAGKGLHSYDNYNLALAGGSAALPAFASLKIDDMGNVEQSLTPAKNLSKKELKAKKKAERKAKRKARKELRKKLRMFFAGGSCGLAIFLIILLVLPLCAGICLIGFGIAGEVAAGAAVGLVLLGLVLTAASIWGMIGLAKWCSKGNGS